MNVNGWFPGNQPFTHPRFPVLRSSTASGSAARRLDPCLASGHSQVRKRGWGWLCASLPHYNPISSACHFNLSTRKHLHTQPNHTCIHTLTNEPPHDKTNNVVVRPVKTQISLGGSTVLWRWASGEAASVGHTKSCSCRPATQCTYTISENI